MIAALFPRPSLVAIYCLLFDQRDGAHLRAADDAVAGAGHGARVLLSRAVAAHVSGGRLSNLLGPAIGGLLYVLDPHSPTPPAHY